MPVYKCSNNKWKIGKKGKCIYDTEEIAEKAYKGYLATKHINKEELPEVDKELIEYKECSGGIMEGIKEIIQKMLGKTKKIISLEKEELIKAGIKIYLGTLSEDEIAENEDVLTIHNGKNSNIEWDTSMSLPLPNNSVSEVNANDRLMYSRNSVALMNEIYRVLKTGGILYAKVEKGKKIIPPKNEDYSSWNNSTLTFFINDKLRRAQSIYPKFDLIETKEENYNVMVTMKKVVTKVVKSENEFEKARGEGQGKGGEKQGDGGADNCVCPECNTKIKHKKGTPCVDIKCPKCGVSMVGKSEETVKKNAKYVEIVKIDNEKQIMTGIVFQPETEDSDKDMVSMEEIEKGMHKFMETIPKFDVGHDLDIRYDITLIENYLAPTDLMFKSNKKETKVKKGSWIMSVKVADELWKEVKKGKINGFSPWGSALREHDIEEEDNE